MTVFLLARVEVICQLDQVMEYSDYILFEGIHVKMFLEELGI